MPTAETCANLLLVVLLLCSWTTAGAQTTMDLHLAPKFELTKSGLELERRAQPASFFDVLGHRSAVLGYEQRGFEVWTYPLKILEDFELSFRIEGYPLEFRAADLAAQINVRPEATTFTYSHAAFTVRQIIFTPIDETGVVMLLDVKTVLPITVTASFKPRLKLAWPAGLMTNNLSWDEKQHIYYLTEESNHYVGVVGSPLARDISVMPYQEEPRDVPARFVIEPATDSLKTHFIPIVIAGSVEGRDQAQASYARLLGSVRALYENNVAYYKRLDERTTRVITPDQRLNRAFAWAKVGIDKGMATNPLLGTGLLAGFRTSGESERPGFAWFFGRDALWTTLAINSYGDFAATRTALEFLKKFQRADGKIPHEISQSASLIPWFAAYEYPWNSADATPLYVIAHADYWRASGDKQFLKANWDSIVKAYNWSAVSDTDGNNLIENSTGTRFGHGWVEDEPLYPSHEEIYLQGLWIEASRGIAELAESLGRDDFAKKARATAARTTAAIEETYWLPDRGLYAFATKLTASEAPKAAPGPNRVRRQQRMDELAKARLFDEDTVLPAVPLWWRTMVDERAQLQIDQLGSGRLATDWGTRILANDSKLYDPLSYHSGSVWPLFTGWSSMAAYQYGRGHVGYQALMANALLTDAWALGYVTELLSGDFNSPFSRSSHHQVWSEAMVAAPLLRGLLGIAVMDGGRELRFAPQLPANWNQVAVQNLAVGNANYDLSLTRSAGRMEVTIKDSGSAGARGRNPLRLVLLPALPRDASVRRVMVQGHAQKFALSRIGDVQQVEVKLDIKDTEVEIVFEYDEGTEVYLERQAPAAGAQSESLRILRSNADAEKLHLLLEGLGGRSYRFQVHTPRQLLRTDRVTVSTLKNSDQEVSLTFEGPPDLYVRREIAIPFKR